MAAKNPKVVVVGAGVIGLSAAYILAQKNYNVVVISEHLPNDSYKAPEYTSLWAGAHFRPFPSNSESDVRESNYTRQTLKFFKKLSKDHPESTIEFVKGSDWVEAPSDGYKNLDFNYYKDMDDFKVVTGDSSLPKGVNFAASYTTWVINAPLYLQFLFTQLRDRLGVVFIQRRLNSLKEVEQLSAGANYIVNATAYGLQYESGYDSLTYPIRGQILLLKIPSDNRYRNETVTHQGADGNWTYVINRPFDGGCVLGGTKQIGDWDSVPREAEVNAIKDRARTLFPELFVKETESGERDLEIIKSYVGFRPARKGGSRVEIEKIGSKTIAHAYGIGGMGYESSYGMALHAIELLENAITTRSKL